MDRKGIGKGKSGNDCQVSGFRAGLVMMLVTEKRNKGGKIKFAVERAFGSKIISLSKAFYMDGQSNQSLS